MPQPIPAARGGASDQLIKAEASLIKLNEFAAALRGHREEQGYRLNDVARETGISPSTLSRIENAKMQPRFETIVTLCDWMNASVDEFTELQTEPGARSTLDKVRVHLRADRNLSSEAAKEIIDVVRALYQYHLGKREGNK